MVKKPDPRNWKSKIGNKYFKDNYLRALEFRGPDWIPCSVSIFGAVWAKYRDKLRDITARYPFIFGTLIKHKRNFDHINSRHKPDTYFRDNWDCLWYSAKGGYEGQVIEHPLADWSAFDTYKFPDPMKLTERGKRRRGYWFLARYAMKIVKKYGYLRSGGGERLFDRMYFLRGFDNLMMDFATKNPMLPKLIQKLQDHEITLAKKWLEIGVDQVGFHTDIGTQDRLMISPRQFREYIKPMFKVIFQTCRQAGAHVYLSSDGYLLDIVDDLVECGVSVHDPQLRANTLKGIEKIYKGKMCIDLDLDRQSFPFATPDELKKQIKDAVDTLNSPEGGLMMKAEIGDVNIPLENIEAICEAMQEYCVLS
ncbi:MAG: uroporphyrinogen decarboxylase family protein [Candidatus Hodarchaeota archaeon]